MKLIDFDINHLSSDKVATTKSQRELLLTQIPNWEIIKKDDIEQLFCCFKCTDFVAAMDFASHITMLAEKADHHPILIIEWGKVSVFWWSHYLQDLHINDFIMAANTQKAHNSL